MSEITGQRFTRLTVVSDSGMRTPGDTRLYYCRCDCGNVTLATRAALTRRQKRSCGCLRRESIIERNKATAKVRREVRGATPPPTSPKARAAVAEPDAEGWYRFTARVNHVGHDGRAFRIPAAVTRALRATGWSATQAVEVKLAGRAPFRTHGYDTSPIVVYVPKAHAAGLGETETIELRDGRDQAPTP